MTAFGIVLLIVGVIIFAFSFFIPDKADRQTRKEKEKQQEEIRRLLEKELDSMKLRVNEATNETVEYGMDKCERSLEKISNEKIMAVNEYSTTIMDEMDKKHKEIMFLYDMLNDKQVDIKNTVRKAEATAKEVSDAAKEASQQVEVMQAAPVIQPVQQQDMAMYAQPETMAQPEFIPAKEATSGMSSYMQPEATFVPRSELSSLQGTEPVRYHGVIDESVFETMERKPSAGTVAEPLFSMAMSEGIEDTFDTDVTVTTLERPEQPVEPQANPDDYREASFVSGGNNNERILAMHAQGVPVVDIARELNLGVGEVKLVIDLYN